MNTMQVYLQVKQEEVDTNNFKFSTAKKLNINKGRDIRN